MLPRRGHAGASGMKLSLSFKVSPSLILKPPLDVIV